MNWEKKWERFAMDYIQQLSDRPKQEWSKHYSQICLLTSHIVLACTVTHINEFKLKTKDFDAKKFRKQLSKKNEQEVASLLKYVTMDFLLLLIEQQEVRDFLATHDVTDFAFETEMFHCLAFTNQEEAMYYKLKTISGTLEHSVHLVQMIGAPSEAKNEGLLLGIEYFKKNFFDNLKKHLFSVFEKAHPSND